MILCFDHIFTFLWFFLNRRWVLPYEILTQLVSNFNFIRFYKFQHKKEESLNYNCDGQFCSNPNWNSITILIVLQIWLDSCHRNKSNNKYYQNYIKCVSKEEEHNPLTKDMYKIHHRIKFILRFKFQMLRNLVHF